MISLCSCMVLGSDGPPWSLNGHLWSPGNGPWQSSPWVPEFCFLLPGHALLPGPALPLVLGLRSPWAPAWSFVPGGAPPPSLVPKWSHLVLATVPLGLLNSPCWPWSWFSLVPQWSPFGPWSWVPEGSLALVMVSHGPSMAPCGLW